MYLINPVHSQLTLYYNVKYDQSTVAQMAERTIPTLQSGSYETALLSVSCIVAYAIESIFWGDFIAHIIQHSLC